MKNKLRLDPFSTPRKVLSIISDSRFLSEFKSIAIDSNQSGFLATFYYKGVYHRVKLMIAVENEPFQDPYEEDI